LLPKQIDSGQKKGQKSNMDDHHVLLDLPMSVGAPAPIIAGAGQRDQKIG